MRSAVYILRERPTIITRNSRYVMLRPAVVNVRAHHVPADELGRDMAALDSEAYWQTRFRTKLA